MIQKRGRELGQMLLTAYLEAMEVGGDESAWMEVFDDVVEEVRPQDLEVFAGLLKTLLMAFKLAASQWATLDTKSFPGGDAHKASQQELVREIAINMERVIGRLEDEATGNR